MNEEETISDKVLEGIKEHFKFLFDKGYVIHSAKMHSVAYDAWEVILKHQDYYLKLEEERGGLDLSFGSPSKGFIATHALIYFLSKEKVFIEVSLIAFLLSNSMKREASLLQKHIEEFELCFGNDFPKHQEGLKSAEQRYFDRLRLSVGNVESPPEAKKNPVLAALILFPVFLIAYAFLVGMIASSLADRLNFEVVPAIIWFASSLLAVECILVQQETLADCIWEKITLWMVVNSISFSGRRRINSYSAVPDYPNLAVLTIGVENYHSHKSS